MKWLALCMGLMASIAFAHAAAPPPPADLLARAGIDQQLGTQLPMHVRFIDAHGHLASLSQWMDGRPTVLMLGYFRCPNLCAVTQQAMAHALARANLRPGTDVSVIFLSIDPSESGADAVHAQQHLQNMGDAVAADTDAWHFLMGSKSAVSAVAAAAGYRYDYDPDLKQFMHPAGAMIVRPDGTINQYLMGVNFVPRTVRLAVVAASHYSLGNLGDQLVLLCCGYDPTTGRYTVTIVHMMQGLGVAFLGLMVILFTLLRAGRRRAAG
jgi:protein SCO1